MKRKIFLLICAVLIAALLIGVLAACDPGSKEQGGSQTPGGTQLPGNGGGGGTQTPGDNDQDDEQGGEVIEPAKLIFEKTDAGYSVTGYEGTPTAVVIPETYEGLPVTSIRNWAFWYCTSLTSITIPDSVTSIGLGAFTGCTSLTSVTIGSGVTSIGDTAFVSCLSLERLTVAPGNSVYHSAGNCIVETATGTLIQGCNNSVIPTDGSVKSIGSSAFAGCTSLTSVIIPDSVTSIGDMAFVGCTSLERLTVAPGNPVYRSAGNCIIETETGTLIQGCKSSVIPDDGSVTSIGESAFFNCNSLTSIVIPESVTSIGSDAFSGCNKLIEVYNKSSLEITAGSSDHGVVGYYAKHVYTEEGGSWLTDTEDGFRFFYDGETGYLVTYLGSETELTLPESFTAYDGTEVTSYQIYDYAFFGRDDLTAIAIPDSVTSIGLYAFNDCDSLETLTVAPGNPKYHGAGNCIIETATKTLVVGFKSSVIPDDGSVTSIGDYAFGYCGSLTSIVIPDSVTSIGSFTFYNCDSLTSVTIPNGVTSIGDSGFAWCTSLTSVTIGNGVTSIGSEAFFYCRALTSITIPDSVTSIGEDVFWGCNSLTSIVIPDSVTSIGDSAFAWCTSLTSVTIGNGVTSIGYYAFDGCTSLTSIVIPDSVTSIESYAFRDCTSLTSITIGNGVTSIGNNAFYNCDSLTSVTFEGTMAEWEAVEKGWVWNYECPFKEVECSDGTVVV